MLPLHLALLLTLTLQAPPPPADAGAPREEHFVLELLDPVLASEVDALAPGADGGARVLADVQRAGLAVCRRRDDDGVRTLEWDVRLPHHDVRVLHVESRVGASERLIWRELEPGAGRSVSVERSAAGLERREWAGRTGKREGVHPVPAARYPLDVLEALRARALEDGAVLAGFDPLSNSIEELRVRTTELDAGDLRLLELVRADGTRFARYLLRGEELLAFQWQAGCLRGRRVERADFERAALEFEQAPGSPSR